MPITQQLFSKAEQRLHSNITTSRELSITPYQKLTEKSQMDHTQNVKCFLAGREFTVPLEEIDSFYDTLLNYLDALGESISERVPNPVDLAKVLVNTGREYVIERSSDCQAERVLRISLRLIRRVAPDDHELLFENLRLLGIICCRLGKYSDAQRYDIEASYAAQRAGLNPW